MPEMRKETQPQLKQRCSVGSTFPEKSLKAVEVRKRSDLIIERIFGLFV